MYPPRTGFTLAELLICACADVWKDEGEVLATGITRADGGIAVDVTGMRLEIGIARV